MKQSDKVNLKDLTHHSKKKMIHPTHVAAADSLAVEAVVAAIELEAAPAEGAAEGGSHCHSALLPYFLITAADFGWFQACCCSCCRRRCRC
jgi:hypothetical protein